MNRGCQVRIEEKKIFIAKEIEPIAFLLLTNIIFEI